MRYALLFPTYTRRGPIQIVSQVLAGVAMLTTFGTYVRRNRTSRCTRVLVHLCCADIAKHTLYTSVNNFPYVSTPT